MPGEKFPNTPAINEGETGPDNGGYNAIMDGENIPEAPVRDESTKFGDVAEGTEFGVNEELEAAADKILAEATSPETPEPEITEESEEEIIPKDEKAEEKKEIAGVLPDGTRIYGSSEDFNEAMKDYYDNIRDVVS